MLISRISRYWICQLGGWSFFAILQLYNHYISNKEEGGISAKQVYATLIFTITGIIFTHIFRYFLKKYDIVNRPSDKTFLYVIVGFVLMCVLYSTTIYLILTNGSNLYEDNATPIVSIMISSVLSAVIFGPWTLAYYIYHYYERTRKQQYDRLRLETTVKELELQTIKNHINPHFIFNALNSIRALIDENPSRARNAVTELSNILRSSMHAEKLTTVPLQKELDIVKDYLALEHIRFEDRIRVEYDLDPDTMEQPIPPMMLQTLVENAIKHGISKRIDGGKVKIVSRFADNHHELLVLNTGQLDAMPNKDGFGLVSTMDRLKLLFGDDGSFTICNTADNMVECKVKMPVASGIKKPILKAV
jgi:two-component system, LytTR family, sensor kinase